MIIRKAVPFAASALGLLLLAPGSRAQQPPLPVPSAPPSAASGSALPAGGPFLDLSSIDSSVKPCADFYQYANGKWLARTPIPPDQASWGTFNIIQDRNLTILHAIAQASAADTSASEGSAAGKVGSFYRSGMDEARIEADGAKPLAPEIAAIKAVHDQPSLLREMAHLQRLQIDAGFGLGVGQDQKRSTQQIVQVGQGGLGMPDRDYYLKTDKATLAVRAAYVAYMTQVFGLTGDTPAQAAAHAQTVLALETRLARASFTNVQERDPQATYHKMTLTSLGALAPNVDWPGYFAHVGVAQPGGFNVGEPSFFQALGSELRNTPLADWKTYLRWHLLAQEAPRLSSPFVNARFAYTQTLSGAKQLQPRWKRVLAATNSAVGFDLGRLYVAQTFTPAAKARALALVQNLKAALRDDLQTLPWMSAVTRQKAVAKLDKMAIKIGYPDRWRDYSSLHVNSPSYVVNAMRADEFEFQRELNKVGKPVDRGEWGMTPPTVNAYYNPQMNDINFPAGILQPGFFNAQADDAVNYGAIGMVIGHEMTHGFDDEGRQFDGSGNLHNWWMAQDAARFKQRADSIVAQFDAYAPLPGDPINGRLTLGENIADLGGLKIAYLAFEKSMQGKPRPPLIDGLSPEQRFFLAFAQSWHENIRPELLRAGLVTDPHSPARFRVLGPISNLPEFYQAFGCTPPAPAVASAKTPAQVSIW